MPKINICVSCNIRMRRLHVRNQGYNEFGKYFNRYIPIGWICLSCGFIEKSHKQILKLSF